VINTNKHLDVIKKINVTLLTSDNSNYKQIKTNEIKINVTNNVYIKNLKNLRIVTF